MFIKVNTKKILFNQLNNKNKISLGRQMMKGVPIYFWGAIRAKAEIFWQNQEKTLLIFVNLLFQILF